MGLACAVGSACTDRGPTAGGDVAPLDLRPSFQVDPVLFPSSPVDRIRLLARDASTSVQVGSADVTVSPTATQWTLSLAIALGDAPSRDVLVDVELLTGAAAQWSGRLGPITVRSGAITPVQDVGLNRGPLDNLDVVALDVTGAPTWIPVGGTAVVVANPTLVAGSTVTPRVFWASTNTGVATITSEGLAATLTGIAAGTTEIIAVAGTVSVEIDLEVRANAPPGFDLEWRGTTNDWHTASNWSTGQVPTAADDVYIPASAVQPTTNADVTVAGLTVAAGATLTLGDVGLLVSGDLHAHGLVTGGNFVAMIGSGATVRGTIDTALQIVGGTVSASGALATTDVEIIGSTSVLDVGGHTVDVANGLFTLAGGVLQMATAGGRLNTLHATFGGGGVSFLVAGELHVLGNLEVQTAESFVAGGTHLTVFEGPSDRFVEFLSPGITTGRFQNVVFDSPGSVAVLSDLVAMGSVTIAQGSVEMSDLALSVGGALADPNGGLTVAQLRLISQVTALPASLSTDVYVDAAVDWPTNTTITGSLFVASTLDVGPGRTVSVSGTIFLTSGSRLIVDGTLTAGNGCVNDGAIISGTGQHPCGTQSFSKTWVGGTVGAANDWHTATNWSPAGVPGPTDTVLIPADLGVTLSQNATVASLVATDFASIDLGSFSLEVTGDADLELAVVLNGVIRITGPGSVLRGNFGDLEVATDRVLSGPVYTAGDLTISGGYLDPNGQYVQVGGELLVLGPTSQLVMIRPGDNVYVNGDVVFDGGDHTNILQNGTLSLGGNLTVTSRSATGFAASNDHWLQFVADGAQQASFALPGSGQQRVANVLIASTLGTTFVTSMHVIEDVSVSGSWSVPANSTVTIDGLLTMLPGSSLTVDGAVTAAGGCVSNGATITGSGTHPCPPPPPADRVFVGGDTSGSLTAWENPANWQPAGVPLPTETVRIAGGNNQAVLNGNAAVAGLIIDVGSAMNLANFSLTVSGDVSSDGTVFNGPIIATGQGTLRGFFDDLVVGSPRSLSEFVYAFGDVDVRAPFSLGQGSLTVLGSLSVTTNQGSLILADAQASAVVQGDVLFDGAGSAGALVAGQIAVQGDFTVGDTWAPDAFRSTGTGVTLYGTTPQAVTFSNPGLGGQAFSSLSLATSADVFLASDVVVEESLFAISSSVSRLQSPAALSVLGSIFVDQATFDGVPVRLTTAVEPSFHYMNGVTFMNMPADQAQLRLELPGSGANAPFSIASPVFSTTPTTGFYLEVVNTSQQGQQLVVQVLNPTPSTPGNFVSTSGAPVQVVWPYP